MSSQDNATITVGRKSGERWTVTVAVGDETCVDKVDLLSVKTRGKFADALESRFPALSAADLVDQLEEIAASVSADQANQQGGSDNDAERLVRLADGDGIELFRTPGGIEASAYAVVRRDDHRELWAVESAGFESLMRRRFYEEFQEVPGAQALTDALGVLTARASCEGEEHDVAIRVASADGAVYVDLVNDEWSIVRVDRDGWEVVPSDEVPVRFVRKQGMLSLPPPEPGGSIELLRDLVNLPREQDFVLYVSVLCFYFSGGPFPILIINGEQGSAKTTASEIARTLIDPNRGSLRRPPASERDLMVAAVNGWVVAFDNLSGLRAEMSDALCALATGTSLSSRALYKDDEEKVLTAMRPILMNGIDDFATRPDLLNRAVVLTLPRIPAAGRQTRAAIDALLETRKAKVFGALLDGVATRLRREESIVLPEKPRMADFAMGAAAAETAFGWAEGTFIEAYRQNELEMNSYVVDHSVVARMAMTLVEEQGRWTGTATDLLNVIQGRSNEFPTAQHSDQPRTAKRVANELRRKAGALEALGVEIETNARRPGGQRERMIIIQRTPSSDGGDCRDCRDCCPGESSPGQVGFSDGGAVRAGSEEDFSGAEQDSDDDEVLL